MKKLIKLIYPHVSNNMKVLLEKIIKRIDGGEYWSKLLRDIYKDNYGVSIGIGTYGVFYQEKYKYIKKVGNYTSIASELDYFPRNHPKEYASTHPIFFNNKLGGVEDDKIEYEFLEIGNDVWIGKDVKITNKCHNIGNGAIIGTGSVVTKNVEPYTIIAGNPARIIGKRFDDTTIELLEKSKWFELSKDEIVKYIELVSNPIEFSKKIIQDYERIK